ncbi:hypothetical protein OAI86_00595 [Alphaproteobacteria bacterium]|nr:hypothetical protein [Alphaproteobacteria bacterium]
MQTIICMKWGSRYGPEFVNRLYSSIMRHTIRPTKLYCFTDVDENIHPEVICKPLPEINLPETISLTPWRKLSVWQQPLNNLKGDVLFLDLDLVITGNLDMFFDYKPGKYCVIENWTQIGQNIGNTSCFRFPIGKYDTVFTKFQKDPIKIWKKYHIEQIYLSKEIKDQIFWPSDWCKSFKHNLLPKWPFRIWKPANLPKHTSVVAFTGKPDPDDVINGIWPVKKSQFYKKIYKQLKTPKWVLENWL